MTFVFNPSMAVTTQPQFSFDVPPQTITVSKFLYRQPVIRNQQACVRQPMRGTNEAEIVAKAKHHCNQVPIIVLFQTVLEELCLHECRDFSLEIRLASRHHQVGDTLHPLRS
jgi:hypothetical protein